jgi:hypothetical protein
MCAFFFQNWHKPVGVFITGMMLAGLIVQPATAANSPKPWFTLELLPVTQNVCPKHKVKLTYILKFNNQEYLDQLDKNKLAPLEPLVPVGGTSTDVPRMEFTESQGNVFDKELQANPDPFIKIWWEEITYIPDHIGDATIQVKASYRGATESDKWEIKVKECKFDIEINADQSGIKLPTGQTFNEAQHDVQFVIFLKGLAKGVLADKLMGEGGSGGNQRPANEALPSPNMDDATGQMEFFGDAIWLGGDHSDFVCGTRGAMTANREITVHPIPGEESIEFAIDVASGMSSPFTVWCEGEGGGGENTVPPTASKPYAINVVLPWEGGTSHYIDQLPYGITVDYLVSAFPMEEE